VSDRVRVHVYAGSSPTRRSSALAESRDLDELRGRYGQQAAAAFARHAAQGMAQAGLTAFPEQPVPASVPGAGGVPAYPALQDDRSEEHPSELQSRANLVCRPLLQ